VTHPIEDTMVGEPPTASHIETTPFQSGKGSEQNLPLPILQQHTNRSTRVQEENVRGMSGEERRKGGGKIG